MSSNRNGSSSSLRGDTGGGTRDVSIAVLGEGATGKSGTFTRLLHVGPASNDCVHVVHRLLSYHPALIVRFLTGRFLHTYDPTLGESKKLIHVFVHYTN